VFRPTPGCIALLAELDRLACDSVLLDGRLSARAAVDLGAELGLGLVIALGAGSDGSEPEVRELPREIPASGQGSVTILTSGTTGKPKAVRHTWTSLCRPVRALCGDVPPRWLLTYQAHLYAGLQVMLQCLANGGTLVVPDADMPPDDVTELMRSARVESASAPPSYWRRLLLFAGADRLAAVPLSQITLGGEVVDQQILDALRRVFPRARIVHIYATTELGRCFSVSDGKAGFPVHLLRAPTPDGVALRVDDGELLVCSPGAMPMDSAAAGDHRALAPAPAWHRTGDLVAVAGDRVTFIGRRSELINVGGHKVSPIEVERVVRSVPGVSDVRVYGRRSSMTGQLVACQVVAGAGADTHDLQAAIASACLARLTPYQRPRLIDLVEEVALETSGKTARRRDQ
jgi:acyl-CoA synthetase (AMP-forming)/AMP-acid ligase II